MANNEESFYYENNSFTYESYAEQLEPQNSLNNDVSLAAFGTNDVEQPEKNKEFGANQEESDEGDVQILTVLEGAGYIPQERDEASDSDASFIGNGLDTSKNTFKQGEKSSEEEYSEEESSEEEYEENNLSQNHSGQVKTDSRTDNVTQFSAKGKVARSRVSWVWNHFKKISDTQAQCTICTRNDQAEQSTPKKLYGMKSTTSLEYHLIHVHHIPKPNATKRAPKRKTKDTSKVKPGKKQTTLVDCGLIPKMSKSRQKKLNRMLAEWIGGDMLPAYIVHGRGFLRFMRYALPGWKTPHRTTLTRTYIPELVKIVKEDARADLMKALHLVFTTDVWTDDYARNAYMTTTAHFINKEWKMMVSVFINLLILMHLFIL